MPRDDAVLILAIFKEVMQQSGQDTGSFFDTLSEQINSIPEECRLQRVLEALKFRNFLPAELTLLVFQKIIARFRQRLNCTANYVPEVYPGEITFFKAVPPGEEGSHLPDEDTALHQLSTKTIRLCRIPGEHVTLLNEPHVKGLAHALSQCIQECFVAQ